MKSDMVLFLDEGKVYEYDTPLNLLANPTSKFFQMNETLKKIKTQKEWKPFAVVKLLIIKYFKISSKYFEAKFLKRKT